MTDQTVAVKVQEILGTKVKLTDEQIAELNGSLSFKKQRKAKSNYQFIADYDGEQKLAPQERLLIKSIKTLKKAVSMEDWAIQADKDGLMTKQDTTRIVAYYRKHLIDLGIIKEIPIAESK